MIKKTITYKCRHCGSQNIVKMIVTVAANQVTVDFVRVEEGQVIYSYIIK